MPEFRKKPVVISAVRVVDALRDAAHAWTELPTWLADAYDAGVVVFASDGVIINTLEGRMRGGLEDWIIRGVQGELYACKPAIFEASYEQEAHGSDGDDDA